MTESPSRATFGEPSKQMSDSRIKLSSGRMLGFAEYGDPLGVPMFFFHGWPCSRLQGEIMDETGKKLGLRIIAPDRPGIATSDFHPGRVLRDWPPVLHELADHLGLDKFHVLGVSGGGPYVLVCAHSMPERLLGAGVICGAPPLREVGTDGLMWAYKLGMLAQKYLPFTLPVGLRVSAWVAGRDLMQWPQTWITRGYPVEDRRALANPKHFRIAMQAVRAALLSHASAVRCDGMMYSSNWDFDSADIKMPVRFWHGAQDNNIPLALAQKAATRIPGAHFKVYPNDGHNSLPLLRIEEMVLELLEGVKVC